MSTAAGVDRPAGARPRADLRRADGTPLRLEGRPLAAGGEARIFAVAGAPTRVAKLLHRPTDEHAAKVAWMIAHPPRGAAVPDGVHVAWPREQLFDAKGRFAGFVMARARGLRLFELFNPATRLERAPDADSAVLHRTGRSLAAAFRALHASGCVLGDVNESNVLVDAAGGVTLVDADSFQVTDAESGAVHRSRVGRPEYTPPELQDCVFTEVDRAPEHDRFGLAVLLFQLLMEGTHPFAGRYPAGVDAPPVGERISAGHFPYAGGADPPSRPPRLAPPFGMLHPRLQALFRRAFVDGHGDASVRPAAAEWEAALAEAEAALVACDDEPRHRFGTHLSACPWCERVRRLGVRDPWGGGRTASAAAVRASGGLPSAGRAPSALTAPPSAAERLARTLGLDGPANGWMLAAPVCALSAIAGGTPLALAALLCTWCGWRAAARQPSTEQEPLRISVLATMLLMVLALLVAAQPDGAVPVGGSAPEVVIESPAAETPPGATLLTPGAALDVAWSVRPDLVAERGETVVARGFFVVGRSGEVDNGPYVTWSLEDGAAPLSPDEAAVVRRAAERVALAMRFPPPERDQTVGYLVRWRPDRIDLEMLDAGVTFTRPTPSSAASDGEAGVANVVSAERALEVAMRHADGIAPASGAPFEAVGEVRVDASGRARPETFELRRMGGARPVASTERVERALRAVAGGMRFERGADGRRAELTVRWFPDAVQVVHPGGAVFAAGEVRRTSRTTTGGERIHDLGTVDAAPALRDPERAREILLRHVPSPLPAPVDRVAAHARFVVDTRGRVEPGSVELDEVRIGVGSTEVSAGPTVRREVARAARAALGETRFRPAEVGGHPVRVYVEMPLGWVIDP